MLYLIMRKLLIIASMSLGLISSTQAHVIRHYHQHRYIHAELTVFSAKSFLVADMNGLILKEKDGDSIRSIASISKLMLAILVSDQDLNESLNIPNVRHVHSNIPFGILSLTRKELLTLTLIKSDNFAAQILCENLPDCINQMNEKAIDLGMLNTHYVEPTGLNRENVSTAEDLVKLLIAATTHPVIPELSSQPNAEIPIGKHIIKINNTNPLTSKFKILLSKTGYTSPAGGCLAMIIDSPAGQRIMIILGSKNVHSRIPDMLKLISEL